jgi:uncharacterized membrane protein
VSRRRQIIIGVVLILIGVAFASLSKEWIEETIGFEPDGGSGLVELLIALVPIAVGVALIGVAVLRSHRAAPERASRADQS